MHFSGYRWVLVIGVLWLSACGGGGGGAPANQPPTANAGPDLVVDEQTTVTLDGSGTDSDGSITGYAWTQTGGPGVTMNGANAATMTFTAPAVPVGTVTLNFRLTVTDDDGASASDDVVVTVNTTNQAPVANAGPDQSVDEQSPVTLTGSGTDADGSIASYSWAQTAGPMVTLSGATTATPGFMAPSLSVSATLVFELTVTDDRGASAADTVSVVVNPVAGLNDLPVANAGADMNAASGATVTLDGTQSMDPDGTIVSYSWVQTSGVAVTLMNANAAQATFPAPVVTQNEVMTFDLTVTDNEGASATDSVTVTVLPAVAVTGKATFDLVPANASGIGLDYGNTQVTGIPLATVEAVSGKTVLATARTDAGGNFTLLVPANTDMFVRVKAEMVQSGVPSWDVRVVDNTSGGALYVLDSKTFNSGSGSTQNLHAQSGWGGSGYTAPREAAPFAILYDAYLAVQKVVEADPNAQLPALSMNWSVNNVAADGDVALGQITTSHYNSQLGELFVLGDENSDTDEFDDHVIIHEWGHYFEDKMSRSDSIGGGHGQGDKLDPRVALGEGWGNAWSGMATDDPLYFDTSGNMQASGFTINVESQSGGGSPGWYSEATVQAYLYDLYDSSDDGADTVSLGFAPIYQVLVGAERTTPALTTVFSFNEAIRSANPSVAAGIDALLAASGISGSDAWATGETNDAGNSQDVLPVYTQIPVDGSSVTLCSTAAFGSSTGNYNKLSVRRFGRLDISVPGTYQIAVTGPAGSDPDVFVFQQGTAVIAGTGSADGSEVASGTLAQGTYALTVEDWKNTQDSTPTTARTCLTLTVSQM
jgi:hypothetical protein